MRQTRVIKHGNTWKIKRENLQPNLCSQLKQGSKHHVYMQNGILKYRFSGKYTVAMDRDLEEVKYCIIMLSNISAISLLNLEMFRNWLVGLFI